MEKWTVMPEPVPLFRLSYAISIFLTALVDFVVFAAVVVVCRFFVLYF